MDIETEKNIMTDMIEYRIRDAQIIVAQARKIESLEEEIKELKSKISSFESDSS